MTRAEQLKSELFLCRAARRSLREALAAVFPDGQPVRLSGGRGGTVLARGYGQDGDIVKVGLGGAAYELVDAQVLLRLNPQLGTAAAEGRG